MHLSFFLAFSHKNPQNIYREGGGGESEIEREREKEGEREGERQREGRERGTQKRERERKRASERERERAQFQMVNNQYSHYFLHTKIGCNRIKTENEKLFEHLKVTLLKLDRFRLCPPA